MYNAVFLGTIPVPELGLEAWNERERAFQEKEIATVKKKELAKDGKFKGRK